MQFIITHIRWIMLASGLLTCTMLFAAIAPATALQGMFGESLEGPLAELIVRNWGVLVTLVGAMLIYGAFHPDQRRLSLLVASVSKLVFIGLVLSVGSAYLGKAAVTIVFDSVVVAIFVAYLVSTRGKVLGM